VNQLIRQTTDTIKINKELQIYHSHIMSLLTAQSHKASQATTISQ